jgi:hypothetical protein
MLLASMLTCVTCYHWLKNITQPPRALLVSVLVLFMPYRMEAMLFRAGYAEIWGLALMPLFFMSLHRLMLQKPTAMPATAGATGLLLLTHVPLAMVSAVIGAIYVLVMGGRDRLRLAGRAVLAALWGISMAVFYIVPAIYFRRFMQPPEQAGETPWANGFLSAQNVTEQGRVVAGDAMAMLALVLLALITLWRCKTIANKHTRREVKAWLAGSVLAALLLFPVSAPLYDALKPWSGIVFPWRMQAVFVFATAFLLAVWMEHFVKPKKLKTWKADYGMLLALMVLLSFFMVGVRPDDKTLEQKIITTRLAAEPEYRTIWTDAVHFNDAYFFARMDKKPPQAQIVSGRGKLVVEQWNWDDMVIDADIARAATVRLDHFYFPIWSAQLEGGQTIELRAEDKTGQILLVLPAGQSRVHIDYGLLNHMPIIIIIISLLSLKAWGSCLLGLMRYKLARMALTTPKAHARFPA